VSRRTVETPDYVGFAARVIRAAGRRVGQGDDWELAELLSLRAEVEDAIAAAVTGQRAQGHSWAYIAEGLGVTRQTAYERYSKRVAA
jgi:hypothetical protein